MSTKPESAGGHIPPEPLFDLTGFVRRFFFTHRLLRIWLIFIGIIALTVALNQWAVDWVNKGLTAVTAEMTAFVLRLLGEQARTNGRMLIASPCTFEIIGECTAYYPIGVYIAAVMAYPCRMRTRLVGVGLGVPALVLINLGRVVSLCYAYQWFRSDFETLHVVVWQSLMMFLTFLLWTISCFLTTVT